MPIEHGFTPTILSLLAGEYGEDNAASILDASELLGYLNEKTKSASKGSKSRASFGTIYTIYVLVADYIAKGFGSSGLYSEYEGTRFTDLMRHVRKLPFGSKLQNHYFNNRTNSEFKNCFPTCQWQPILHDEVTTRYWINENLLNVTLGKESFNIAVAVIRIIDAYIAAKREAFEGFIADCERIQKLSKKKPDEAKEFIARLLKPNVDARIFEITSFAVLKEHYGQESIFWGWTEADLQQEFLMLYKTGRCNANDGGIDFVMCPLGRFFQVTETTDVKKYFLDIDKVQRYPVTFVVKSELSRENILQKIRQQAAKLFGVKTVVKRYMDCVEEIINIPTLLERFEGLANDNRISPVIDELILQSQVEFNYDES